MVDSIMRFGKVPKPKLAKPISAVNYGFNLSSHFWLSTYPLLFSSVVYVNLKTHKPQQRCSTHQLFVN
jgi:hypothetical protein